MRSEAWGEGCKTDAIFCRFDKAFVEFVGAVFGEASVS